MLRTRSSLACTSPPSLAPAVVLALSAFVTDAGLLYISVLATGTVLTVLAGWGVSRTAGIAVSLGRHTATRLLAVLPFCVVVVSSR